MKKGSESKAMMAKIGSWAFIIGVLLAAFAGVFNFDAGMTLVVLGVLGLIVGFLNISASETVPFLVATVAIMSAVGALSSALSSLLVVIPGTSNWIPVFLGNIVAFVAPAAGLVALKTIYELSKSAD